MMDDEKVNRDKNGETDGVNLEVVPKKKKDEVSLVCLDFRLVIAGKWTTRPSKSHRQLQLVERQLL